MKKVIGIRSIGKQTVYDLTVKDNHNYYAEGTLLHNCDYRGEIGVILHNVSNDSIEQINPGDRIAQLVLCPVYTCQWEEVNELGITERGEGGFGSTKVA
jgi:dUTPase